MKRYVETLFHKTGRIAATAGLALGLAAAAQAEPVNYTITIATDFTGPFANVMDSWHGGQTAMINWWNDTRGKELGVNIDYKAYDMRYDASVIAKTWPSIVSGDEPIIHLGMGSPDLVSLMNRLPQDKIPMINGTAMIGPAWTPNGWHFSARPTYSHEFSGVFEYLRRQLPEDRPLRIGAVTTMGVAGYEDQVNGVVKLTETYPDKFEMVGIASVPRQPVSITGEVQRIVRRKPDAILVGTTTTHAVATIHALQELGADVPIVTSSHNGLTELTKMLSMKDLEGSYSAFSLAPYLEEGLDARAIYEEYNTSDGPWGQTAVQSAAQTVLAMRVLERAIEEVGAENVDGQAMYDAIMAGPFDKSQLLGLLPTIEFSKKAPFPTGELKVKALTVKDGELISVSDDWLPVPSIPKW